MRHQVQDRVVTIGGGTGSFTMLSELKKVARNLWAIVAMTDSGGSSRRLMDEFGHPLPLGDVRQALVALSRSRKLWGDIFRYRFPDAPGGEVGGHSLGNLILHALEDQNDGDLLAALEDAEELLNAAGHVVPVTLERATLCAELSDGAIVRGESAIDRPIDASSRGRSRYSPGTPASTMVTSFASSTRYALMMLLSPMRWMPGAIRISNLPPPPTVEPTAPSCAPSCSARQTADLPEASGCLRTALYVIHPPFGLLPDIWHPP